MPGPADGRLINLLDSSSLSHRMTINMYHVSMLVAKVKAEAISATYYHLWDGFLRAFEAIERQYIQWERDAMILIGYQKKECPDKSAGSHPSVHSCYHIYQGPWTTSIWNKHRAARIILHQTFLDVVSPVTTGSDCNMFHSDNCDWSAVSRSIIQDMINDILASVPFSLGDIPTMYTTTSPKSVSGYFLIWSLQVIIRCTFASKEQQNDARSILLRVGRQCGISYATIFAQNFVSKERIIATGNGVDFDLVDKEILAY
jgi:hypothetical protein